MRFQNYTYYNMLNVFGKQYDVIMQNWYNLK